MIAMLRKTLLAVTLAAGALVAATTGSQAGYGYGHGYNYGYSYRYQPSYSYSYGYQPYYYNCRYVKYRVYDDYYGYYVYRTKKICG
jgi:hypothetical protein